jgi:ATP-dependent RNA helicase HelY
MPTDTPDQLIAAFGADYGFALDDFQLAGISALIEGRSTLVCAPTGAGKTVVGEFAIWHALRRGRKCFYTTPIKALSNQKYGDLVERYGADRVGLLTGDNVVNGEAPVVVMTTEVLRNMLYEASPTLRNLGAVVLDEVHYLADRSRGAVWEEVIIQLAGDVQLAALSATVSNAEEFGAWLGSVRGADPAVLTEASAGTGAAKPGTRSASEASAGTGAAKPGTRSASEASAGTGAADAGCDIVISEHRPVPLEHSYAVNDRLYPVFKAGRAGGRKQPASKEAAARQAKAGVPNPEVIMLERRAGVSNRMSQRGRRQPSDVRVRPPRRSALIKELRARKWLPAIYFLFSRNGCNDAVDQLVRDGVRLTTPAQQERIRRIVDARTGHLPPEDLEVLGYGPWAAALERGISAHHAGMVPLFKETVEELFTEGLLGVCFATETLALGINMPARTVVIERLEKWDGERHVLLTPGQFTQLTGRAGRRGLDPVGHAVVAYQRDIDFPTVASLVGRRIEPLRSSFAPSYNMAVNLLRRRDRAEAERLLARSFAQYQADGRVGGEEVTIARNREALAGYAENLRSEIGDFPSYWALRRELTRLESAGAASRKRRRSEAIEQGLADLREGDVVALPRGDGPPDLVAIIGRTVSKSGTPLASAITTDRKLIRIGPREFDRTPRVVGRVTLPKGGGPRQTTWRKQVASEVRRIDGPRSKGKPMKVAVDDDAAARIAELREEIREHPVHHDPRLPEIEVWAHRHDTLLADTERLERAVRRRSGSLVRELDKILDVLVELGYLSDDRIDPEPTRDGRILGTLYAETDLVLAECLRRGVLDGLDAPSMAAVASAFVHETRLKDPPPPRFPTDEVAQTIEAAVRVWGEVVRREEDAGLKPTRPLDAGFVDIVWRWSMGAELDDALGYSDLTAGDFVRSVKQVADLLRQIRDARSGTAVGDTAHAAATSLVRGVVAYSGL